MSAIWRRPYRRKYNFAFWFYDVSHLGIKAKTFLGTKFRPDISIHSQYITTPGCWKQASAIFKLTSYWFLHDGGLFYRGVEFPIFLLICACALQQYSANALPVIPQWQFSRLPCGAVGPPTCTLDNVAPNPLECLNSLLPAYNIRTSDLSAWLTCACHYNSPTAAPHLITWYTSTVHVFTSCIRRVKSFWKRTSSALVWSPLPLASDQNRYHELIPASKIVSC